MAQVNWKVRFKNKVWLTSFISAILTFIYTMLGMFDIYPEITKNDIGEIINSLLMFLSLTGVIVDPTTVGIGDSKRAMSYEEPYDDSKDTEIHTVEPVEEEFHLISEEDPDVLTEINAEKPPDEGNG